MKMQCFPASNLEGPSAAGHTYVFWCPGCKCHHTFNVGREKRPVWTFDGNMDAPTFSPSLLYPDKTPRCHLFLRGGKLEFLSDCGHELAGKTVDLPDIPPDQLW
jgi:hypothetical protein